MAKRNVTFPVVLYQNRNQFSHGFGYFYAKPLSQQALSLKGICALVGFDQSVFTDDIVQGVVEKVTTVMVEQLKRGQPIKWDGLGTFTPGVENAKGGISADELKAKKWNAGKYVKGIHINFIPEGSKGEELTSRKFKDICTFVTEGVETKTDVVLGDKKEIRRVLTPLKEWVKNGGKATPPAADGDDDGNGGEGGGNG